MMMSTTVKTTAALQRIVAVTMYLAHTPSDERAVKGPATMNNLPVATAIAFLSMLSATAWMTAEITVMRRPAPLQPQQQQEQQHLLVAQKNLGVMGGVFQSI